MNDKNSQSEETATSYYDGFKIGRARGKSLGFSLGLCTSFTVICLSEKFQLIYYSKEKWETDHTWHQATFWDSASIPVFFLLLFYFVFHDNIRRWFSWKT